MTTLPPFSKTVLYPVFVEGSTLPRSYRRHVGGYSCLWVHNSTLRLRSKGAFIPSRQASDYHVGGQGGEILTL